MCGINKREKVGYRDTPTKQAMVFILFPLKIPTPVLKESKASWKCLHSSETRQAWTLNEYSPVDA